MNGPLRNDKRLILSKQVTYSQNPQDLAGCQWWWLLKATCRCGSKGGPWGPSPPSDHQFWGPNFCRHCNSVVQNLAWAPLTKILDPHLANYGSYSHWPWQDRKRSTQWEDEFFTWSSWAHWKTNQWDLIAISQHYQILPVDVLISWTESNDVCILSWVSILVVMILIFFRILIRSKWKTCISIRSKQTWSVASNTFCQNTSLCCQVSYFDISNM